MSTRENEKPTDCYNRLEFDEPYFVLMGRDPDFEILVRTWAHWRTRQIATGVRADNPEERAQIAEALACASEGEIWRREWHVKKEREACTYDDKGYVVTRYGMPVELGKKGS